MFLALGFGPATPVLASKLSIPYYSTSTAEQIVDAYAVHWGVSGDQMWATIQCEDPSLDPTAQSTDYLNGVREDSWGVAQIHLTAHPDITKAEEQDPFFAINWMAKEFSLGHQSEWTCWRKAHPTQ